MTKAKTQLHEVLEQNMKLERQNQTLAEELEQITGQNPKLDESKDDSFTLLTTNVRDRA